MGATAEAGGVNFAVFSATAQRIDLCLFDESGTRHVATHALPARTGDVWHGFVPDARAGLIYGLRAHGRWAPGEGWRFNPHKLLLDPWAREIVGTFDWRDEHFGHLRGNPMRMNQIDNASVALKARVVDDHYDWQGDTPPLTAPDDTVLYELHVRGFTIRNPNVPPAQRGTYAGLASDAALAHFKALGVTALSLLPVHQHLDEERLGPLRLSNYWGYNTIGFFCPHPAYAMSPEGRAVRDEFRTMVRKLHAAGLEVILDVVYNHTAETDAFGPHLCWRGLDDANWYRHPADRPEAYENDTGCGNTVDLRHPRVIQFVMDSLRWWVAEMHVDGFRFDLAPVLGRGSEGFQRHHPFFAAVAQDPVLARVKLIAEPWDIGPGGYRLGDFPTGWMEWNDKFRDTMRAFWLGHECTRGDFAQRLCGSANIFRTRGRAPAEGVNYIAAHDGFTLNDLVSYEKRHNLANAEHNHDGHAHNLSRNFGVEGQTADAAVLKVRARVQRALIACNVLAQGTPMLAAGAELGHTQGGNNNAYCQDNEMSWLDWPAADVALQAFTARVLAIRRQWRPLDGHWYDGITGADGRADLAWRTPGGAALSAAGWQDWQQRALAVHIGQPGREGPPLLLLVNAHAHDVTFELPPGPWSCLLDTAVADGCTSANFDVRAVLAAHGLLLLQQQADQAAA
jgi:glycogen operon protein